VAENGMKKNEFAFGIAQAWAIRHKTPKPSEDLGENLKRLRMCRGLSQRQLGEKLGLVGQDAGSTIYRMESGRVTPSIARLRVLAEALNVKVKDLIG